MRLLMGNHLHLLLEVPPMAAGGLSDAELLHRLRAIYNTAVVAVVAKELAEARQSMKDGLADESSVRGIHERYTYRMHDLGEFMKTLLLRFSRWFNTKHERGAEDAWQRRGGGRDVVEYQGVDATDFLLRRNSWRRAMLKFDLDERLGRDA